MRHAAHSFHPWPRTHSLHGAEVRTLPRMHRHVLHRTGARCTDAWWERDVWFVVHRVRRLDHPTGSYLCTTQEKHPELVEELGNTAVSVMYRMGELFDDDSESESESEGEGDLTEQLREAKERKLELKDEVRELRREIKQLKSKSESEAGSLKGQLRAAKETVVKLKLQLRVAKESIRKLSSQVREQQWVIKQLKNEDID